LINDSIYSNIPEAFTSRPNWVLWNYKTVNGRKTKVPIQPSGMYAKSNDPSTWSTFNDVLEAVERPDSAFAGIGWCVPLDGDIHYWGIDVDDAIDPETGDLSTWPDATIQPEELWNQPTYTEITPSGAGFRLFFICDSQVTGGNKKDFGSRNQRTDKVPGVEFYSSGRFFTFTGNKREGAPCLVADGNQIAKAIHAQVFGKVEKPALKPAQPENHCVELASAVSDYILELAIDIAAWRKPDTSRHNLMFSLSGLLVSLDWQHERIVGLYSSLIALFLEQDAQYDVGLNLHKQGENLEKVFARVNSNLVVPGWKALREFFDPAGFTKLEARLKAETKSHHSSSSRVEDVLAMLRSQHLTKRNAPEFVYLIEPEIVQGTITLVSGKPGCGKTTLIMKWCKEIAESGTNVLYLNKDNPEIVFHDRNERLGGLPDNFLVWGLWNRQETGEYCEPPELNSPLLDELIRKLAPCLVVVDTFRAFSSGDENDNGAVSEFLKPLRKWTGYGATAMVIHHQDKEGKHWFRGASSMEGAVDVGLLITAEIVGGKITKQTVTGKKSRMGDDINVAYSMIEGVPTRTTVTLNDRISMLLKQHQNGISKEAFEKECTAAGFRRATIRQFIDVQLSFGRIVYEKKKLYPRNREIADLLTVANESGDETGDQLVEMAAQL
jgi:archaellum biogenesis ATPase FlaH